MQKLTVFLQNEKQSKTERQPTEGYGIFIENMLNAADFAEQQKAA